SSGRSSPPPCNTGRTAAAASEKYLAALGSGEPQTWIGCIGCGGGAMDRVTKLLRLSAGILLGCLGIAQAAWIPKVNRGKPHGPAATGMERIPGGQVWMGSH